MLDRNGDLSELLAASARMAGIAARHELNVLSHLLNLVELEVIRALYADSEDSMPPADVKPPRRRVRAKEGTPRS